jgi:hypothetical protein
VSRRIFITLFIGLSILVIITSPPLVRPFLQQEPTPTATPVTPTTTPTATNTPDPFAGVPTATPRANGVIIEVQSLPSPALGDLPPTFTPTSLATSITTPAILLPDPTISESSTAPLPAPTPVTMPPDRLSITRLALDVPVVPVGMVPVPGSGAFIVAAMPPGKVAGWVNISASFGQPGNTVLIGRHQAKGLTVFHGLWMLETGDEIVLQAGQQSRRYVVAEVLILPEQEQPVETRLANAEHVLPTEDERLTIVTGWPEKSNSHRTVVIAFPE